MGKSTTLFLATALILVLVSYGTYRAGERAGFVAGVYSGAFDMWACVNIAVDLSKCPRPTPPEAP